MENPHEERSNTTNTSKAESNSRADSRVAYLEGVDFHRDLILKAIKHIRIAKAPKECEIKAYLSGYNIPLSDVDICIRKLHDRGDIEAYMNRNCVSYLDSNEVKKVGIRLNKPSISEKLGKSIRFLISKAKGSTDSGFTEEEIKEALYEIESETNIPPELKGFTLRRTLAVESKYGILLELPNGCYTLKEIDEISPCEGGDQRSLHADTAIKVGEKRELCPQGSQDSSIPLKQHKLSPVARKSPEATPNTLKLAERMSDLEMKKSESFATDLNAHSKSNDTNTNENSHFSESPISDEFETQPPLITNSDELMEYLLSPQSEEEIMSGIPRWAKDPD
nr:hypothetical protein HmN_000092400 [Hymenolepis microstoma]